MVTIAVIISIIALAGAGFAFLRANSTHHILSKRIESLKERIKYLEANQNKLQSASNRGTKPALEQTETGRKNLPRQEQQPERQEPRQKQRERQPQQERPQQERQTPQPDRQLQERRPQEKQLPQQQETLQPEQQKRKKENRRRNEPRERMNYNEPEREQQLPASNGIRLEIAGSDLLDELEQEAGLSQPAPMPEAESEVLAESGILYAIIPEDGVIRQHQLQLRPDSDSYIEIDTPADGSNMTRYRFNLGGNHAFVISQGIDRLENAFDFEKPSNRMVSRIVQQQDGVLAKVNNGWRIQEKARIDFR
ncbi:hypothetical protein H8S95_11300 [Pontibacter sp. KCTC 32443]|uniref:hypothetical protein n=1 Tax=Pontibacter TaxID=323449 RepID=UPI00164E8F55|nr:MULTISPECIES: hypothetical protein [Pontibacter]MBC5774649.1 hypothetical protein [Pontibacter sp. KCTC 32443]